MPGLFHAWYIIAKFPEPPYEYETLSEEGGRVTYVYVQSPQGHNARQPAPHGGMNYGTQHPQQHGTTNAASGSNGGDGVPPSYASVVSGDHKVQPGN